MILPQLSLQGQLLLTGKWYGNLMIKKLLILIAFTFNLGLAQTMPIPKPTNGHLTGPALTGMKLWISGDCAVTVSPCTTYADGTQMTTTNAGWADRSVNVDNLLAVGIFSFCVLHTNQLNGYPTVTFPITGCGFTLLNTFGATDTSFTTFAVFKRSDTTSIGIFTGGQAFIPTNTSQYAMYTGPPNGSAVQKQLAIAAGETTAIAYGNANPDTNWHVLMTQYTVASAWQFQIDGTVDSSGTSSVPITADMVYIGLDRSMSAYNFTIYGQLAELLIYSGSAVLSPSDTLKTTTYLRTKYGL